MESIMGEMIIDCWEGERLLGEHQIRQEMALAWTKAAAVKTEQKNVKDIYEHHKLVSDQVWGQNSQDAGLGNWMGRGQCHLLGWGMQEEEEEVWGQHDEFFFGPV